MASFPLTTSILISRAFLIHSLYDLLYPLLLQNKAQNLSYKVAAIGQQKQFYHIRWMTDFFPSYWHCEFMVNPI